MNWRIERLERLAALKEKGALSEDEFQAEKELLLRGDECATGTPDLPHVKAAGTAPIPEKVESEGQYPLDPMAREDAEAANPDSAPSVLGGLEVSDDESESPYLDPHQAIGDHDAKPLKQMGWLKWPVGAGFAIGALFLLSKIGVGLGLLIGLCGFAVHCYANAQQSLEARSVAMKTYVGAVILFGTGLIAEQIVPQSLSGISVEAETSGEGQTQLPADQRPTAEDCAAYRREIQTYGQIEAMCRRVTAGSPGASIAASVCLSDKVNRLRSCGIEIHQSPF